MLSGYIYNDFQFEYDEGALPQNGCSVTFNGQFWYIGGSGRPEKDDHPYRQVRMHLFDFKQVKRWYLFSQYTLFQTIFRAIEVLQKVSPAFLNGHRLYYFRFHF